MENLKSADLGDGTYQNPIIGGDFPDPAVCRASDDYYMVHSSFVYSPGLVLWKSKDLVNWQPIGSPLTKAYPRIFGSEIVYYKNRFYIYFPSFSRIFVTTAVNAEGPWTIPKWTGILGIDPAHIADAEGNRFLYVNHGKVAPLSSDGLKATGKLRQVYNGWQIPRDWIIEGEALEGPKLFFKSPYYYLINSMGGTAGPATSHMVIVARSKTPIGPWENSPHNPILHTHNRDEKWWSQGHGTILDTPAGDWWMMYHGYEKGFHTLGRQTLLVPISWTDDKWPVLKPGTDPAKPISKPYGINMGYNHHLSDDFSTEKLGVQWRFWMHTPLWRAALFTPKLFTDYKVGQKSLQLKATGRDPGNGRLMLCIPEDHSYEISVQVDCPRHGEAGLLLYYNPRCFTGIVLQNNNSIQLFRKNSSWIRIEPKALAVIPQYLKIRNFQHEVVFFYSDNGAKWHMIPRGVEVSGYHHNVFGGFLSLRVALYGAGRGTATFREFKYSSLPE